MAIHFPNAAYTGQTYLADNGVEYIYDGVKWVGYGTSVNVVTDHLLAGNVDLYLYSNGVVQLPEGGDIVDSTGQSVLASGFSTGNYEFTDDVIHMPADARLNSGGIDNTGSAELGTQVLFYSYQYPSNVIQHSEIYMGSGAGEFRSIYDNSNSQQNSLTYAGVEDVMSGKFSGVVSQTPDVYSMYSVALDANSNIIIGAAQQDGALTSDDWGTGLGTLNAGYTVNGIYANSTQTQINGGTATTKMNLSDDGLVVSTADTQSWTFGPDGNLTFPNGNLTIGHDPYGDPAIIGAAGKNIGLVSSGVGDGYEVGSSLIWVDSITEPTKMAGVTANNPLYVGAGDVGIVTGDYFYTGNTNVWNFGADGNITLPVNGYILNSDLTVYGGASAVTGLPAYNLSGNPGILTVNGSGVASWHQNDALSINGYGIGMTGTNCNINFQHGGDLFAEFIVNSSLFNQKSVGNVVITSNRFAGPHDWSFGIDGNLVLPAGGYVLNSDKTVYGGSSVSTADLAFVTGAMYRFAGVIVENADLSHAATSALIIPANGSGVDAQLNNSNGNVTIGTGDTSINHKWNFNKNGNLYLPSNSFIINSDNSIYGQSSVVTGTQTITLDNNLNRNIITQTGSLLHFIPSGIYGGTDNHEISIDFVPADGSRLLIYNDCPFISNVYYGGANPVSMDPNGSRMEMVFTTVNFAPGWLPLWYTQSLI